MAKSFEPSDTPPEYVISGAHMDPRIPLRNLSTVWERMDSVQRFLSESVNSNTIIAKHQMEFVSSEFAAAIHQIIVNGTALLYCSQQQQLLQPPPALDPSCLLQNPNPSEKRSGDKCVGEEDLNDYDIVELDAVELLAEHVHHCEICGKGFKRDANLRMHMRAHGDKYKTPEALSKPAPQQNGGDPDELLTAHRKTRFSCPFKGCNRNRKHKRFRPLKSVICVKNHFKRSHCPKLYACHRCRKKSFSVLADLKSHLKHCGEGTRWRCSCGTSFSRKDKLFGHVANFEGHMPAVLVEEDTKNEVAMEEEEEEDAEGGEEERQRRAGKVGEEIVSGGMDDGFLEGLLDGFNSIENYCLQDILGSPSGLETTAEGLL